MILALRQIFEKADKRKIFRDICSEYIPVLLLSLLFIVPLTDSSKMFNGIVSAKKYYFYLFMLIIIVYNSILFIYEKRFNSIVLNKIDIAFLLYAGWNLVSAIITNDSYINDKTGELVMLVAYYFIIKAYLSDKNKHAIFFNTTSFVLISVALIESAIGLLQIYGMIPTNNPYFRITGTFNNPAPYALMLSVAFAYALASCFFNWHIHRYVKYVSYLTSFLIINVIPFTLNRASWIGIIVSTILTLLYFLHTSGYLSRLFSWTKICIALILFISAGIGLTNLYNLKKDSSSGRLLIWKVSTTIFKDHTLTGIGYGRFRSVYNPYQADYLKKSSNETDKFVAGNTWLAFNDYIETLVETGILGLIFLLSLIYSIFTSFKIKRDLLFHYICPIIVLLILSIVSFPINAIGSKILFFYFLASFSCLTKTNDGRFFLLGIIKFEFVIALLASIIISLININKLEKYDVFSFASNSLSAGRYDIAEDYFHKINSSLRYESYFSYLYADCLFKNKKYNEALEVANIASVAYPDPELFTLIGNLHTVIGNYNSASEYYNKSNFMVPSRIVPKYYLAKFYYARNEFSKADSLAKVILRMKVKVKSDSTVSIQKEIGILYRKNKQPVVNARQGQ